MTIPFRTALGEVYQYREVLYHLLVRDLRLKHKHTKLGYLWSLLNPVFQMSVLTVVFSHLVRLEMRDYTLFIFSGMLPWMFFQSSWFIGSYAFIENQNFIKKVYLPKLVFPLARVIVRWTDYLFSLVALSLIAWVMGFSIQPTVWMLPAAIVLMFLFTLGVTVTMAVAVVFLRDLLHLQTVLMQLLYFATPILYPLEVMPEKYRPLMALNPLYTQIRLFQRLIYDGVAPSAAEWGMAAAMALAFFSLGLLALRAADDELVFRL